MVRRRSEQAETPLIPGLAERSRPKRPSPSEKEQPSVIREEPLDLPPSIEAAATLSKVCRRCDLYRYGTQTVFGEGPEDAPVMFVGEQPGDKEDQAGRSFVGPAGRLFNEILEEAGIARERCYVTNAVKHFKHEQRGSFRLHKKPDASEIEACKWWLRIELNLVKPKLIVALGATATQALTGNGQAILKRRGKIELGVAGDTPILISIHPSALLRIPDPQAFDSARAQFLGDMRLVSEQVPDVNRASE